MAYNLRKFLYMGSEGPAYEQGVAPTEGDYVNLPGLTVGSGTFAAGKITGVTAASASGDVLVYGQNAASLAGLTMSGNVAMGSNQVTGLTGGDADGEALAYGQTGAHLHGLDIAAADLTMNSQKITGLGAPVNGGDAANKTYVDAFVVQGGEVKEYLANQNQISDSLGVLSAGILTMQVLPVTGDTITLTNGTTTRTYGAGTGGDVQYTIGANIGATMDNFAVAVLFDASSAWTAFHDHALTSYDPDGCIVLIEKSSASALSSIYGTWATPANCQIIDHYGEVQYIKRTLINMPGSAPANPNFGMHRAKASLKPGEIHWSASNDTQYYWNDDAQNWMVMSGPLSIPDATAASGGGIKGKITVDSDYGLTVNPAGTLRINLASNPGLEYSSGALRIKPDTAQGIGRASTGIYMVLDSNAGLYFNTGALAIQLDTNPGLQLSSNKLSALLKTDAGMGKDANGLYVVSNTNAGIVVDAFGVGIDLADTNPGLQFDVSGDLQAKVDTANGLDISSSGIHLDLAASNPGLQFDGSGDLQVKANESCGLTVLSGGVRVKLEAAGTGTGGLLFNGSGEIRVDIADTNPSLVLGSTGVDVKIATAGTGTGGLEASSGGLQVKTDGAHGIILTSTGVEVELNTNGAIVVGATGLSVNCETTAPSLQVVANELGIKFDTAGGLQKLTAGTGIKLNATSPGLALSSSGLNALLKTDAGLGKDANGLYVVSNTNAGIMVNSFGVGIDLADSNPGLQFDVNGDLQLKAYTSQGLHVDSDGVGVTLEAAGSNTGGLAFNGTSGIRVLTDGLHGVMLTSDGVVAKYDSTKGITLFSGALGVYLEPAGTGVGGLQFNSGTNKLEVKADTARAISLTGNGVGINYDTVSLGVNGSNQLYVKSALSNPFTYAESLAIGDPVYFTGSASTVGKALANADSKSWIVGLALEAASSGTHLVACDGSLVTTLSGLTIGVPYYLAAAGGLTSTRPVASGNRVIMVGVAYATTSLLVNIKDFGKVA